MLRRATEGALLVLCLATPGSWGCDDDSSPAADDAAAGDADAHAEDADEGGATGTLNVLVLGSPLLANTAWPPLEGATVALDLPGGSRTEATTDAEGRVHFDGIDWTAGTADLTGWAEGYGFGSLVGLHGAESAVTLVLPNLADPKEGWVELSITALNMTDVAHGVDFDALEAGVFAYGDGTTMPLALRLPPGVPFSIAGVEYSSITDIPGGNTAELHQWAVREFPAVAGPTAIDFDFLPVTPPTSVEGSLLLPSRPDSPLRTSVAYALVYRQIVQSPDGVYVPRILSAFGAPARIARTPDGNHVEYEIAYALPPTPPPAPVTRFFVMRERRLDYLSPPFSLVDYAGLSPSGPQSFAFLDVPEMTDPDVPTTDHPLHEPFAWNLFETNVTPTLYIRMTRTTLGDTNLWWITAQTDDTTLTVPQPPSGVDVAAVLGTGTLRGALGLRAVEPGDGVQDRYSETRSFLVRP